MSLMNYSPFDATSPLTMREAMDRMLEQSFFPAWKADLFAIGRGFPVDVYEDEANYVIEASMPGINPDKLNVTATPNAVTIRAVTAHDAKPEKGAKPEPNGKKAGKSGDYIRRERYSGEVTRLIDFPDTILPESIKATYKHGVLTLEVPKAGESTPRTVKIVVEE
jgi:HSP20 family protein